MQVVTPSTPFLKRTADLGYDVGDYIHRERMDILGKEVCEDPSQILRFSVRCN